MTYQPTDRRPIASRDLPIFQRLARQLATANVSANAISVSSLFFALFAGLAFVLAASADGFWQRAFWFGAALMIQGRLLANLLDGMVAIESGKASRLGELYNEIPDRLSDVVILVGAGYTFGGSPALGYLAAIAAVLTAYVRAFGASLGVKQLFIGPMSKSHRMFTLTLLALYLAFAPAAWRPMLAGGWGLPAFVLLLITVGSLLTVARRIGRIVSNLNEKAA